jgi:hypothetical protein
MGPTTHDGKNERVHAAARRVLRRMYMKPYLIVMSAFLCLADVMQASSVTLQSATAQPGGTVSVPISFTTSGDQVSSIGWTFTYSAADFTSIQFVAGSAAASADKQLSCYQVSVGQQSCIISGSNASELANGVIATAVLTVAAAPSSASTSLGLPEVTAASPIADAASVSATGAAITINMPAALTGLSCSPTSLETGSTATCTVSLSKAAADGFTVSLGYTSAQTVNVNMPSSVTIPAGASSANVSAQINTNAASTITLTATSAGLTKAAVLSVMPRVAISPAAVTLSASQTVQFAANLPSGSIAWTLSPAAGTVSASGLYKAPAVSAAQTVTVKAASTSNPANFSTATITLMPSLDLTPPSISSVTAAPSATSARIQWMTTEMAMPKVIYGTSPAILGSTVTTGTMTASPVLALDGLAAGTTYYYRVVSTDAAQNEAMWPSTAVTPASFRTLDVPAPAAPENVMVFWPGAVTPDEMQANDPDSVELGMKFYTDMAGTINGVRFYKGGSDNSGPHTGTLWTSAGKKLASVSFASETASGWQTAYFATPVAIIPGQTYVVSYHAAEGHYSATESFFSTGVHTGSLHTPASAGVFRYGASAFPNQSYMKANYWVDVIFAPNERPVTPSATGVLAGSLRTGTAASLSSDDNAFYQITSMASGSYRTDWSATMSGIPTTAVSLSVTYRGKNSVACTETLSIWNGRSGSWTTLDSRSIGTTEVLRTVSVPGPVSDYIIDGTAGAGNVRARVECASTGSAFISSGDLFRVSYR